MLRDILHMSKAEISQMNILEYAEAFLYAGFTYVSRAINLPSKKESKEPNTPKSKGFKFEWTHDAIRKKIAEAYNR